jgi:hypothetical protein
MNNVVSFLIKHLGIQELVDIALPIEIEQLRREDRPAIVRSVSLSENTVRRLCAKTGGDFAAQMVRRDAAANAFADLVLGFAPTGEPNAAA